MRYRVRVAVGYCEALFDFDNVESAAHFLQTAVVHNVESKEDRSANVTLYHVAQEDEE